MTIPQDSSPPGEFYCPNCEKTFQIGDRCPNDGTKLVKLSVRVDPFLGRELDGRYTILEKLGQGGMGAVYRSAQHGLGREVAIKVVSSHLVSEPEVIKRFLREAKLASKLAHPNAVAVLDFGQTDDGLFYLVMELVVGRTLDIVIKSEKVFKPERVVRIGTQVCDALQGAHELQIVHRDLKPSNIMLLSSGRDLVKVLDFGLAKSVAPDQTSTTMTNAGALLGTPAFMPPELALGQPCDSRADLYSLGCVLYLLGSGRLPFQSESAHELIAAHGTEDAPKMTGVPPALGRVVDRLLKKDPNERFQSAADAREALEAALEGRYNTPVPGTYETSPSLGPFPAKTGDFAMLSTPSPRKQRSEREIEELESEDTVAALDNSALHGSSMRVTPKRRWVVPVLAGLGALAIGAGVFFAIQDQAQPVRQLQPEPQPRPAPGPPPAPTPNPEPAPETKPEITVAPPPPAPTPTLTKKKTPTTRHVKLEKREPPAPVPPPPADTGSATPKKAALPF